MVLAQRVPWHFCLGSVLLVPSDMQGMGLQNHVDSTQAIKPSELSKPHQNCNKSCTSSYRHNSVTYFSCQNPC